MVATSSDPRLGAIRLAWWRERLEALQDGSAPAEPRLRAVAAQLLPCGVTGEELSHLEDAWLPLLQPFPWDELQAEGLRLRGRILFGIGAKLLGGAAAEGEAAGALWSLTDGASHCSDEQSRVFLVGEATHSLFELPLRIARVLRPMTVLAALAAYDVFPRGRFGRGGSALHHRLTGRFPR